MANLSDQAVSPNSASSNGADLWCDAVMVAMRNHPGAQLFDADACILAARHAAGFPASFRQASTPDDAAADIVHILRLKQDCGGKSDTKLVQLRRRAGDRPDRLRLKLYQIVDTLILSDAVSILENFGFKVADCYPHGLDHDGENLGHIHDFLLGFDAPDNAAIMDGLLENAATLNASLDAVFRGTCENDPFNLLISRVGLDAEETNWLRALYRYLRQTGIAYSVPTAVAAFVGAPRVTLGLVALFRTRHEPDRDKAGTDEAHAAEVITAGLAAVESINHDRLLRAMRDTILAIVRTNAFARRGGEALAFKFDSALVPGLVKPIPWREIFVYSDRVEGIHLRSGPIARGGLRWSDRRDDFRTEVLSLMKAQRVKNAIIVPTGAKGGFYPKRLPDRVVDREGWAAEGHAAYQEFVMSLLCVTDDIRGGKAVHPNSIVIRDGADPYLVVAADKGTASFSDSANEIAASRGYWLGDAFASGGANGYDHKAMGITARGAWISVQRHFAERGINVQSDPVSVLGVGDMSGDVFGNGMLLSRSIRLVAAFDHRHVFLDPQPDNAAAWAERKRLFGLSHSSWADYDPELISPGGGVFSRAQKTILLSPEAQSLLGVDQKEIEPDALIRAILAAPADLLWFGGIGTYVKGRDEPNSAVGDPANDGVRINAADLRVGVIAEGANLGCTQAGRIEAGLAGIACNADFIDNSAGVDCSDKEVNIKIALSEACRTGRLDEAARVALLAAMTEEVADLVLDDNRMQALGISQAHALGADGMASCLWLVDLLESAGHLDPVTEGIPEPEALKRRAAEGQGLTRSELAVLFSSAKLAVQDALERSPLLDDAALADELDAAFPAAMRDAFRAEIQGHSLRREILATRLANRLINRLGFIHPFEIAAEEGVGLAEVAIAYFGAERLFRMNEVWKEIEAASMPEAGRIKLLAAAARSLRPHVADLLGTALTGSGPLGRSEALIKYVRDLEGFEGGHQSLRSGGATAEVKISRLAQLDGVIGLAEIACADGGDVRRLAAAFSGLADVLSLSWLQKAAATLAPRDYWERVVLKALGRDIKSALLEFVRRHAGSASGHSIESRLHDVARHRR